MNPKQTSSRELDRPNDPKASVKFAISDEVPAKNKDSKTGTVVSNGKGKSSSRFKVAKVEFVDEKAETSLHEDEGNANALNGAGGDTPENSVDRDKPKRTRTSSRQESICSVEGPTSPNDTYTGQTYDTRNLKTFGRNTLETLPHLDHYRNVLSATGGIRKRPTLLELHEQEKVRYFTTDLC